MLCAWGSLVLPIFTPSPAPWLLGGSVPCPWSLASLSCLSCGSPEEPQLNHRVGLACVL